jgi:hypothetical protein
MSEEMVIASLVRSGEIVVCGYNYKQKLRIDPECYRLIVTKPNQIKDESKKIHFIGSLSDEERRIWRSYMEARKSSR